MSRISSIPRKASTGDPFFEIVCYNRDVESLAGEEQNMYVLVKHHSLVLSAIRALTSLLIPISCSCGVKMAGLQPSGTPPMAAVAMKSLL